MRSLFWRISFISLLLLCAKFAPAAGLGVNDIHQLDGIQVDDKSGTITLLLVIDRPLEDGLTKPRAIRKLNAYSEWVHSAELGKAFPHARTDLGIRILITHPRARSALGKAVLSQLAGRCKDLHFEAIFSLRDTKL